MTDVTKVKSAVITVAGIELECYQLANGEYRMSLSQVANAIKVQNIQAKNLLGKNGNVLVPQTVATTGKGRGKTGEKPLMYLVNTEEAVTVWQYYANKGNTEAVSLAIALMSETLERRADAAFGVKKTEATYEEQTRAFFRELARKSFQPKYTGWLKSDSEDGVAQYGINYGKCVNDLKKFAGLPLANIDHYDTEATQRWSEAITMYNTHRVTGQTHANALKLVKQTVVYSD